MDQEARSKPVPESPLRTWLELLGWIVLCLAAGGFGTLFTFDGVRSWYPTLAKPPWTPPNAVFGPVWTCLYLAMAVAAWRVARQRGRRDVRGAIVLFLVQLALNTAWSFLFFGAHLLGVSFGEIALLLGAIVLTIARFAPIDRIAALLLLPYLLWVTYATALNGVIWWLNRVS